MPARVALPHLIQDRQYLRDGGDMLLSTPVQEFSALDDGHFRDGPVHPRLAVVDLDAERHTLRPPLRYRPRARGRTVSAYDLGGEAPDAHSSIGAFETDEFLKLNPFATALKTLYYFESPEILGRPVRWAFPSEQLLIVPRAGEMKNAFYDRESGSLQFYHHLGAGGFTVYTALSHDIIVHETTHAIVDAVAPDLYHASNPQSLALHEALADLSAITQTLINEMVVFSLDAISSSRLDPVEALSRLAEEFGTDTRVDVGASFLRRLKNRRSLRADDDSVDEFGAANRPDPAEPHGLSQVLSGAVFAVFEQRMKRPAGRRRGGTFATMEQTFCPAGRRVARIVFRALDYLPPGDAGFVDYGRAFLAAARSTYARSRLEQDTLIEEFVRRGIVDRPEDLEPPSLPGLALDRATTDRLRESAAARAEFARDHAAALNIPDGVDCEILPPVDAHRSLRSNPAAKRSRDTIFRFRWTETETHEVADRLPSTWAVARGTTLLVDHNGKVLSLLTTDPGTTAARGALLTRWAEEGRLRARTERLGPDGCPLHDAVRLELTDGVAQTVGGGRTLHLARDLA
jgi:hypothetical protein